MWCGGTGRGTDSFQRLCAFGNVHFFALRCLRFIAWAGRQRSLVVDFVRDNFDYGSGILAVFLKSKTLLYRGSLGCDFPGCLGKSCILRDSDLGTLKYVRKCYIQVWCHNIIQNIIIHQSVINRPIPLRSSLSTILFSICM